MATEKIEVPDGYKIKCEGTVRSYDLGDVLCFPLEKIKPRRIVVEETGEERAYPINGYMYGYIDGAGFVKYKILREVKETDIPLTNSESKLSLSVDECRNVRSLIKDFENLGWFVNPASSLLLQKITEFIKDK